jgi:hypothetical protein
LHIIWLYVLILPETQEALKEYNAKH